MLPISLAKSCMCYKIVQPPRFIQVDIHCRKDKTLLNGCRMVFKLRTPSKGTIQRVNPVRWTVSSTRCGACSKEYFTTRRPTQNHLTYSRQCVNKFRSAGKLVQELLPRLKNTRANKTRHLPVPVLPSDGLGEKELYVHLRLLHKMSTRGTASKPFWAFFCRWMKMVSRRTRWRRSEGFASSVRRASKILQEDALLH